MPTNKPKVGDYDPATGRLTMQIQFGAISRRDRKRLLDLMTAKGLTHDGGPFAPHAVLVTGTEAEFLAYGSAQTAVTGSTSDMPAALLRWHSGREWLGR